MKTKMPQAPHEGMFLKIFMNLDNTRHFLKNHISEELQKRVDLKTLRLGNTTYVDEKLKKHYSDLVFSVDLIGYDNESAKIYLLFEHKSSPEPMTGVQILKYMALQWLELQEQHMLINGKLPPIIPVVIYQGQENTRKMHPSFHDLVDMPSEAFRTYIPDFSFAFFSVRGMDEAKVQEKILLKFYVQIIKMQNDPNIKGLPTRLVRGLLESMEQRTALEYIEIFFRYLVKSSGYLYKEDYKKALDLIPEGGEKIMETLADQWLREGRREGREELLLEKPVWEKQAEIKATQETLIDVAGDFHGPLPNSLQDKIKSIDSIDSLRTLTRKVYRTQSLDEFTELVNQAVQ